LLGVVASIVWLASEPQENRFLRFHSLQGLLLFGVTLVVSLIFRALGAGAELTALLGTGSELAGAGAGLLVDLLSFAVMLLLLVIHLVAMVKASQGQTWKIPVIGDIAEKHS
jgi:uncharacterized membrane protein